MHYVSGVWQEKAGKSELRLESSVEQKTNVLWRKNEGEWVLADELKMTGVERGFDYRVSTGPGKLVMFDSVRLVDGVVVHGPLKGRVIYTEDGSVSADQTVLGYRFCLAVQDARAFSEAVKGIGGRISKQSGESASPTGFIDAQLGRMKAILKEDTEFVQKLVSGAGPVHAPFDERGETFRRLDSEIRDMDPGPETVTQLNEMREARVRAEKLTLRYTGPVEDTVSTQLLFADLVSFLKNTNNPARTDDGIEIPFQGFTVKIGSDGATLVNTITGEVVPAEPAS